VVRTIAIINQKGGCGKTTTAINLASVLAERGHKTLLIDVDPQSHCALGLAVPESQIDKSMADLFRHGLDGQAAFTDVTWQISRNLDLAPSTTALAGIEAELANCSDKDRRLVQVLSTVQDDYEFCIIDCPPSIGLLTFNALRASDEVLIPVETGYFSMQGSVKQEATIEMLARRAGHRCRFKVLATMYDVRTKLAREILSELKRHFGDKLLPVVVHFNSKLKEAASFGQAITEYDPASRGFQDFEKLSDWLIANPPQRHDAPGRPAEQTQASNPAMSRAAELVERARALSRRTAALNARLADDPDVGREATIESPQPAREAPRESATPTTPPKPAPTNGQGNGRGTLAVQQAAPPKPTDDLATKLSRLFGVRKTTQGLLFVQPAGKVEVSGDGRRDVAIAGDFNNWNPKVTPMKRNEDLGVWQAVIQVPPGRYRYRLVVDGEWKQDPYNTYVESNPFGELNNVVEVPA